MTLLATDLVLVTGGNGTLGRFIVDLLWEKHPEIRIRIFDQSVSRGNYFEDRYAKNYHGGDDGNSRIEYITGDLRNASALGRAVRGVSCVFHTASVVDVSLFPDENLMWAVNCRGTQDLVEACYSANVSCIIYTSSVCSITGLERLENATEADCRKPKEWFWNGYGETKWMAEQVVLEADKLPSPNGQLLRTLCLRPTSFYGENDRTSVAVTLRTAPKFGGKICQVGGDDLKMQQTYVGNVAWAHLCAWRSLIEKPEKCGGKAYFIADNTPMLNPCRLAEPFLSDRGIKIAGSLYIPYFVLYFFYFIFSCILQLLKRASLEGKFSKSIPAFAQVKFLGMRNSVRYDLASDLLGYEPLFSFAESVQRSRKYYSRSDLYTNNPDANNDGSRKGI